MNRPAGDGKPLFEESFDGRLTPGWEWVREDKDEWRLRENALEVVEVTGGTITITNLGMFGIDAFTPIINPPEVAILGVGRIVQELALVDGQLVARDGMALSLTIDHRIVDGKGAVTFLKRVKEFIENPERIILEV